MGMVTSTTEEPTVTAAVPPRTPRADTLVDEGVLEGLVEMVEDREVVQDMVDMLVASLPQRLETLRDAERRADRVALAQEAHRLKGVARQLGAGALATAAEAVEAGAASAGLEVLAEPTTRALLAWSRGTQGPGEVREGILQQP